MAGVKNKHGRLKSLEQHLKNLRISLSRLESGMSKMETEKREVQKKISITQNTLNNLKSGEIIITEHAILRYLQRCYELDIEAIKQEIMNSKLQEAVSGLGDGNYTSSEGNCTLVVSDRKVVTILPLEGNT